MTVKSGKGKGGPSVTPDGIDRMGRKLFTVTVATLEGLKAIQSEVPGIESDSAALRYAVLETAGRLKSAKARTPSKRGGGKS